jgi:imidazolonepropionase
VRIATCPPGIGDVAELDAAGACVTPGFVDPHTHLVWAGSRRDDFVDRLAGVPYTEVAARGGGIHSTVRQTRAASYTDLVEQAGARVDAMSRTGTTTVEIKSGYGLTEPDELRLLDVTDELRRTRGEAVESTLLGAHAVPPETDRAAYVDAVVAMLPAARAHRAGWCDVFCDRGAFTVDEARRVLTAARDAGLGLRIHAEQIARTGAAELAAELGCASADHLDHVDAAGARALAAAGVVGVLLPACTLTMGHGDWGAAALLGEPARRSRWAPTATQHQLVRVDAYVIQLAASPTGCRGGGLPRGDGQRRRGAAAHRRRARRARVPR